MNDRKLLQQQLLIQQQQQQLLAARQQLLLQQQMQTLDSPQLNRLRAMASNNPPLRVSQDMALSIQSRLLTEFRNSKSKKYELKVSLHCLSSNACSSHMDTGYCWPHC